MRSTPVAGPGAPRRPFECRVRFHAPLRRARLGSPESLEAEPKHEPAPQPQPKPALPPPTPPAATAPAEPEPTDFWPAALEEELQADRTRIEAVLNEVKLAVVKLREEKTSRIEQWQQAAVELATGIAARLLHERVAADEFPIDAKVRDMIAQLGEDVAVTVRLNPLDLELLKSRLKRAGGESLAEGPDAPRFVADSALNRGECQVEGRESMLISDAARELQEIRDELLRSLGYART